LGKLSWVESCLKKRLTGSVDPVFIGPMKIKTIAVTLALWVLAVGVCFAADPQMGTWKLNEAKSKLGHGMGKNNTVTYSKMMGKVKVTIDGTDANGKSTHNEWTGKFDGKDYPVTGDPHSDMRSYTKVNDHTMNFTAKKGGEVMMSGQITVAADGKSRTVTATGTNPKGKKFASTGVYDKE
jgi:hypothetical protein